MDKWKVQPCFNRSANAGLFEIIDESGSSVAWDLTESLAKQIVREHNAVPGLVESLKAIRDEIDVSDTELSISTTADWFSILERANAVLAQVEGEE